MGVDYLYCGECQECYNDQDFEQCYECSEIFEHPREGYYCCECLPVHEYVVYKEKKYCRECYNHYIIKIKCSICKDMKKKKNFRDCSECSKKLNYIATKVYVCDNCDNDFLCKNCDDKVYFCNKKCSNKYKIWQRKNREALKILEIELESKSNSKKIYDGYDKLCKKCKIFPCGCDSIEGKKRMDEMKQKAIKFDETKWSVLHSCLCDECKIFPCECLSREGYWCVYDCCTCNTYPCKCCVEV